MSLLDNLGSSNNQQVQSKPTINNLAHSIKYISSMLSGRNINAKDLAISLMNKNSNMSGQLKQFLIDNGVTENQLKQNGINI